jgi:hypothetical protein
MILLPRQAFEVLNLKIATEVQLAASIEIQISLGKGQDTITGDDGEAVLKQRFDDTLRLAENFQSGNDYSNAANKFSEAIEIAERLPSAEKDIATLYNNRRFLIISIIYPLTSPPISFSSAMYERCNELDKSLSDIEVVLTMDPEHLEARIRRGRIHEAQVLL